LGVGLADFGRDPHNSDGLRGSRIFFLSDKQRTISCWATFKTFEHNSVDR